MESIVNISVFLVVLSLAVLGIIAVSGLIVWLTRVLGLENYQSLPRQRSNSSYSGDMTIDAGDSGNYNYHDNSGSDAGDCGDSGDNCGGDGGDGGGDS
jgi:hypothetical protein